MRVQVAVKGGDAFTVEIALTSQAPPSGTRVDLTWQGNGLSLIPSFPCADVVKGATSVTCHVEVAASYVPVTIGVPTNPNPGTTKTVTITAASQPTTAAKSATIQITK